jgi:DNA-binding response OmpR family regulator
MNAGAQAYITKPSDPAHLVETIRLLIDIDDRKKRGFPAAAISA